MKLSSISSPLWLGYPRIWRIPDYPVHFPDENEDDTERFIKPTSSQCLDEGNVITFSGSQLKTQTVFREVVVEFRRRISVKSVHSRISSLWVDERIWCPWPPSWKQLKNPQYLEFIVARWAAIFLLVLSRCCRCCIQFHWRWKTNGPRRPEANYDSFDVGSSSSHDGIAWRPFSTRFDRDFATCLSKIGKNTQASNGRWFSFTPTLTRPHFWRFGGKSFYITMWLATPSLYILYT